MGEPYIVVNMDGTDYRSIIKEYGTSGIVGAVILAIAVPVFLSVVLVGKKKAKQRGVHVQVSGEAGLAMRNARQARLVEVPWEGATTMAALFEQYCKKYWGQRFLGRRKLIGRELVTASDGRKFEKPHLGDYQWETYGQVFDRACNYASGLVKLGHDVDTRAAIFSETRAEWFIAFQVDEIVFVFGPFFFFVPFGFLIKIFVFGSGMLPAECYCCYNLCFLRG